MPRKSELRGAADLRIRVVDLAVDGDHSGSYSMVDQNAYQTGTGMRVAEIGEMKWQT